MTPRQEHKIPWRFATLGILGVF